MRKKSIIHQSVWLGIASVSAVFAIALVSFVFPNAVFDTTTDMTKAVSISSTSTVTTVSSSFLMGGSQLDLEYVDDTYYLVFASTSEPNYIIYFTSSSDGTTWSSPQPVTYWATADGRPPAIDLVYSSRNDSLNYVYIENGYGIASSLDGGATWTTSSLASVLPDCVFIQDYSIGLAYAAESDMAAVACGVSATSTPARVDIAVSDDGGDTWSTTSTVFTSTVYESMVQSFISISGGDGEEIVHVLSTSFDSDGDASSPTSTIMTYASSTDGGVTFTSQTIAQFDTLFIPDLGYWSQAGQAAFSADENGYPGFFMRELESLSFGPTVAATSSFLYGKYDGTTWSTSTLGLQETFTELSFPADAISMLFIFNRIDLAYFNTDDPILLYQPDNDTAIIGINTSSFQYSNFFDGVGTDIGSRAVAYNSTEDEIGIVNVSSVDGDMTFYRTNSGVLPGGGGSAPTAPSGLTTSTVSTSSITFTWTDNSGDETSFLFDYVASTSVAAFPGTTSSIAANSTSTTITGLTPNTSYFARVAAVNGDGTSSYSTSTLVVTQAIAPTTLTGSALGRTSVSLDWNDVGGTQYKVYQDGSLIASTALTESTVTGLTCNTAYTFTVKAVNSLDQLSSDTATVSVTTDACASSGGGGTYIPPSKPTLPTGVDATEALRINNNAQETTDRSVMLTITATNVADMAISNTNDFTGTSFVPYSATVANHLLTAGNGTKTVFVKLRSAAGGTITITDTIELTGQDVDEADLVTTPAACPLPVDSAAKATTNNAVYYITLDCTKRAFTRSDIYFTYFTSWSDVTLTPLATLVSIPDDILGFMPWGPRYNPASGALIKTPADPKVYLLLQGTLYHIENETAATYQFGPAWATWVEDVDARLLQNYPISTIGLNTTSRPDGILIKYTDDAKVYQLATEDATQVKRWIPTIEIFRSLNFRDDRIVTIPNTEIYPDGTNISL